VPDVVRGDGHTGPIRVQDVAGGRGVYFQVFNRLLPEANGAPSVVESVAAWSSVKTNGSRPSASDAGHAGHAIVDERRTSGGALGRAELSNAVQNALKPTIVERNNRGCRSGQAWDRSCGGCRVRVL